MRGGHQMCIDVHSDTIYLLGGWDGSRDLADFWSFNTISKQWTCISRNTEQQSGPTARSCHKMCIDPIRKQIFTLGRYLDPSVRTAENLHGDFYLYDIESSKWTLITDDTSAMGGPGLIFDHQMAIDVDKQTIYVFGGRLLSGSHSDGDRNNEPVLSSLYSYHIPTNTWKMLRNEKRDTDLKSRVGHSMLFHPKQRCLYIFAGQRCKEYLNDLQLYEVDTDRIKTINDGTCKDIARVPSAGFTQRATMDPDLNEIHVLTGLSKEREKTDSIQISLWIYKIDKNKWSCVYSNDNTGDLYWNRMQNVEPVPRYAHQLVYDHVKKVHYLFGGNPGKDNSLKMRLDDFWALELCRPTHESLLRECRYLIRKHCFEEMTKTRPVAALKYLQTELFSTVDHSDTQKKQEFQLLPALLFKDGSEDEDLSLDRDPEASQHFTARTKLFDSLVKYFPDDMTQPKGNIIDQISLH